MIIASVNAVPGNVFDTAVGIEAVDVLAGNEAEATIKVDDAGFVAMTEGELAIRRFPSTGHDHQRLRPLYLAERSMALINAALRLGLVISLMVA